MMLVRQNTMGTWDVVEDGIVVATLNSNTAAWDWVDRNETHKTNWKSRKFADKTNAYEVKRK